MRRFSPALLVVCGALVIGAAASIGATAGRAPADIGGAYAVLVVAGLAGTAIAWRRRDRGTLAVVIVAALAARVSLFYSPPLLSHDAYRYLWDAGVLRLGRDPLALAPAAPPLAALRGLPLFGSIDYRTIPSLYPPLAYVLFAIGSISSPNVYGEKAVMLAGDLLAIVLLLAALRARALPLGRVALYAWSPLVLLEFAQNAHVESWAIAGVMGTAIALERERLRAAALWLVFAILVKLTPVALLPVAFARRPRTALACGVACAVAYAVPAACGVPVFGSLGTYVNVQRFFPTLYVALHPAGAALLFAAVVLAATLARRRGLPFAEGAIVVEVAFLLCTPNALPWYATIVPALAVLVEPRDAARVAGLPALALGTSLMPLAYGHPFSGAVIPLSIAVALCTLLVIVRMRLGSSFTIVKDRYGTDALT